MPLKALEVALEEGETRKTTKPMNKSTASIRVMGFVRPSLRAIAMFEGDYGLNWPPGWWLGQG